MDSWHRRDACMFLSLGSWIPYFPYHSTELQIVCFLRFLQLKGLEDFLLKYFIVGGCVVVPCCNKSEANAIQSAKSQSPPRE